MNNIRFFSAILLTVFYSISLIAQDKKVEFGIAAGYGYTMPRLKDNRETTEKQLSPITGYNINSDNLSGFHVGPIVKFNISEQVGFQTGVLFNHFSGLNIDKSNLLLKKLEGTWEQKKTTLNALDLPLRVLYSLTLAEEFNVLLFAGPNLNYSLNKTTSTEYYIKNKFNRVSVGTNIYESDRYNALDLQMGAGMGIKYYGVSLRASYDWGILNRTNYENITLRTNDIKVSLAYTF